VWEKFKNRSDVKKELIKRTKPSERESDLIDGCDGDKECLNYIKKIIDLHNIKFSYSLGKDKLSNLIRIGIEYSNKNKISDDNIEYMLWDLE
jgi:DNA/RNA endonuclease YhcR with UshA esterase domain